MLTRLKNRLLVHLGMFLAGVSDKAQDLMIAVDGIIPDEAWEDYVQELDAKLFPYVTPLGERNTADDNC